ncbi:50S ribosomal protein L3 N(5)-glutamine methyltransferase [Inhella crocodyli]|uniref:50S ribosomal protein L3 N(5)-glutamine methyltransferase n=1 Tax=Inhella crocodyli TaxID=2499851 RepID=A0A3S2UHR9_9BURK|nr:50S ribosomal protein L3 N(5)-glutamine methyltransferase [Inhella crocodyli]RVT88056.1 50S ribosomal protein L3 N(5)-glutamine methyltransferase [Inhella crocodyli]
MALTLMQAVDAAATRLDAAGVAFGQGTTNAFDEAAWLVLWRLQLPVDALDDEADRPVTPDEQAAVDALIDTRIRTRQPAAYLTGEAWLQGVPFHIDARSIVPRSFIAELIADASIDPWLGEHTQRVLDLCTGNGSLAVLAAMAWPELRVVGTDLSEDALAVARRNVERHGLNERIQLLQGDGLAASDGGFDLILCNPPYVNASSMASLPPEFRAEPALALAGGTDGMDFVRRLLAEAPRRLNDRGVLVLEIGHERAHFEAAFPHLEAVWLETSAGADQVLLLTREALLA